MPLLRELCKEKFRKVEVDESDCGSKCCVKMGTCSYINVSLLEQSSVVMYSCECDKFFGNYGTEISRVPSHAACLRV